MALDARSNVLKENFLLSDSGRSWVDHVGDLERELGVVGIRTPNGITLELFEEGMKKFRKSKE
jgi:hypothetical protein